MKLSAFLMMIFTMNVFATGFGQFSFKAEDKKVREVLDIIEQNSNYRFFYNDEFESINKVVNLKVESENINQVLDKLLATSDYTYSLFENNLIVISLKNNVREQSNLQQNIVRGTVKDQEGNPIPGVTIVLKGTTLGTTTDINGNYIINVVDPQSVLVFSFIGYINQEITVGNRSQINISLTEEVVGLEEVVVTALGIKREAKKLGYATATVTADQLTINRELNLVNGLVGKMSGVNITSLSTGPAGSSKIRIRGQSSFSSVNQPLIVVNGVPIDNTSYGLGGGTSARSGQVNSSDGGDSFLSINSDDIESLTVLKGATASALYGSRAKDGVIMITTKTRGKDEGFGVEYTLNFSTETALDYTDFQYEYGQGEGGVRPTTPNPQSGVWSFGEKFEPGMTQILFDGEEWPYEPVYNRYKKFYDIGTNLANTITISNNSEKGGFSASLSNTDNKGIMPLSKFNRKSINLGFNQNINKILTFSGNVNYSNERNTNPPQVNTQDMAVPTTVATLSTSMPFEALEQNQVHPDGSEFVMSRFLVRNNPYYSINYRKENILRDRVIGNLTFRLQLTDWLYFQGRIAQDWYTRYQDYNIPNYYAPRPAAPTGFVSGSYTQDVRNFKERNFDFLIGSTHKINDFGVDISAGGNTMYRKDEYHSVNVNDFIQPGLYTIMNGREKNPLYSLSERQVNSLYGMIDLSYKSFLFLSLTGRNDWFSTLSPENRSILYPSATVSFIFSEAFSSLPDWVTFGKLRAAYAEVGDDNVAPYSNVAYYRFENNLFTNPLGQQVPIGSTTQTQVPNPELRPLRVSEAEVGVELKLFNNKVGFDLTYYNKLTKDQILAVQVSNASSYLTRLVNIGKSRNQGIEALLTVSPIETNSFKWDVNFNVSYNTSEVLKLGLTDADTMISFGNLRYVVGKPIGSLYTYKYLRDDQGRQVFDKKSGKPMRESEQSYVGDALPKWFGGITNTFSYKGIILRTLIDFKLGSKMITGVNQNYLRHGLHKMTLVGREEGYIIGDGVNPDGSINTTPCLLQPFYETPNALGINEDFVDPAGFWKLRQVSLGYDFTKHLGKLRDYISGVTLNLISNNTLIIKKWAENQDPENLASISDTAVGSSFWTALPPTRSFGFNLHVRF